MNFSGVDFLPNAPVKKLDLTGGKNYAGNAVTEFTVSRPFHFEKATRLLP
jgi:hypothetical protein